MLLTQDYGRPAGREAQLEVLTDERSVRRARLEQVRSGLCATPKEISARWHFDERGALLIDELARLPEYYLARRERGILNAHLHDIAKISRAETLVELGRGFSENTEVLLTTLREGGTLQRFMPLDESEHSLRDTLLRAARGYPGVNLSGVVGDFEHHLGAVGGPGRRLMAFLGGGIGNFQPRQRAQFLERLAGAMKVGDSFVVGCDLIKERHRLHAAYNDRDGVMAAFNLNALNVLNRELGATFDVKAFEHEAAFDEDNQWMELMLRSTRDQTVHLEALETRVHFNEGEPLRTGISTKFTAEQVEDELAAAGFRLLEWWSDDAGDYAIVLATRARQQTL